MYRQIGKILVPIKRQKIEIYRTLSSKQAVIEKDPLDQEYSDLTSRLKKKKPQKPPFVKNLFTGKFDTDILAYPETTSDKDEIKAFQNKLKPIKDYFSGIAPQESPDKIFSDIKALKLHALSVPEIENGLELNATERCLVYENMVHYPHLLSILHTHENIGLNTILQYGTETQKAEYLSKMYSGDCLATLCFTEEKRLETIYFQTKANLSTKRDCWELNGTKHWVLNANKSDVFVVFAQTVIKQEEEYVPDIVILLVDKNLDGITINKVESLGVSSAEYCNVTFNNTKVDLSKKIEIGSKNISDVIMSMLTLNRLPVGVECGALSVDLLNRVTKHVINKIPNEIVKDVEWPQKILSEAAITNYAIESVTYLTAGLDDTYENQDLTVESAIVKVFSSESLLKAIQNCAILTSPDCYELNHYLNKYYANVSRFLHFDEPNSTLRQFIALSGLQFIGKDMFEDIKKIRNPLHFPGYIFKKMWGGRNHEQDNPKLVLQLNQYLHPSLGAASQWAEYSVLRLQYASEVLLTRHGQSIVEKHSDLLRLSSVVIDIYVMVAVLSRASRSYCIGLRNADSEVILAGVFCRNAMDRVKETVNEIVNGAYATNDVNHLKISEKVLDTKGHILQHPTARNF